MVAHRNERPDPRGDAPTSSTLEVPGRRPPRRGRDGKAPNMVNPRKTWMPLIALLALFAVAIVSCGPGNGTQPPGGDIEVRIIVDGPGRVIQGPLPYQCRDDCVWTGDGDVITSFFAIPADGYVFVGWGGVCDAFANPCAREFEDGDTITAAFALHALRLDLTGDGEGAFRVQGAGIDATCDDDCAFGLDTPGLLVAITAFPRSARTTVDLAWEGPCDPESVQRNYCLVAVTGLTTVGKTWRHPPVASDEAYVTAGNTTLVVPAPGVLANADDTPSDTLTAERVTNVKHGTLTLAADGGFSYTPDPDFFGSDTFTYRARDAFGNRSNLATVTITVTVLVPPVIVSFTADDATIEDGNSTTLRWTVTGADTITIDDGASNLTIPTDATSIEVTPDTTTTYTLTATNPDGNTTATVTVTVTSVAPDLPTIVSFTATPSTITTGDSSTLAWTVTNATTVEIVDDTETVIYDGTNLDTTTDVTPDTTTTYTLTATNTDGNTTTTTTITVRVPPVIVFFTADDDDIEAGDSTTLRWNVTGADTITIDDAVSNLMIPDDATTIEVSPDTTTTYTLTATNADGSTTETVTVTVIVTVTEIWPIAVDDVYSTTQDSILRRNPGDGVLSNDIGDDLTAILVNDARNGDLTLRDNGSFTYMPNDGFTGTDTFTYFANNGFANSNTAAVTITVNGR